MNNHRLAVIVPAYNEGDRLSTLLKKLSKVFSINDVIVVDDGSAIPVSQRGVLIARHKFNLGKGAALKTGIELAIRNGYSCFILMDADLQHSPDDISQFVKVMNRADIVFGNREFSQDKPVIRSLGAKLAYDFTSILLS